MRNHTKLRAFQLADGLALLVYKVTASFPSDERFGLTSQMRRAAVSTVCNIVEGCARHSEQDFLRFLDMAYGSACELQYQGSLAGRLGFMADGDRRQLDDASSETARVLNGLIRAIREPGTA
jgi:four helix bundle protein